MESYPNRYIAQTRLSEFQSGGQEKLRNSCVLIVGCGALGSPTAMYLAGAGIGHLIIADFDVVDSSNLHRQVFYEEKDLGKRKAEILKTRIIGLNAEIKVNSIVELLTKKSISKFSQMPDVIVDAADNPDTTYHLDEICKDYRIPMVTAGVSGWTAQIFTYVPGSISYGDIFPRPLNEGGILPCSIAGITGPTSAFAASVQAAEVLKLMLGKKGAVSTFLTYDLLNEDFNLLRHGR